MVSSPKWFRCQYLDRTHYNQINSNRSIELEISNFFMQSNRIYATSTGYYIHTHMGRPQVDNIRKEDAQRLGTAELCNRKPHLLSRS